MAHLHDVDSEAQEGPGQPADAGTSRKGQTFYRGDVVNYWPVRADYSSSTFLQDNVLKGWEPAAPFLTKGTKITAFGSCFAANITRHLSALGYDLASNREPEIYISRLTDGLVNIASILGQFEWALENKQYTEALWHGFKAERYGYDENIRLRTRDVFLATEFFIVTLGLSEIWYDEKTGGTFWRAVPEAHFDAARHKFRVLSVEETKSGLEKIYQLIRRHVPDAKVLFTVSPIPLAATFRPVSCLTANTVSKAIIRAALDEFLRDHAADLNSRLFYFPSMEIVQLCFTDPWIDDIRHPKSYVLDTIMKTFEASYCVGEGTIDDANAMLQMFRARNLRDIAESKPPDANQAALLKAARAARDAGIAAREQAKARERERQTPAAAEATNAQDTREERRAAQHAQRQKEKEARRSARSAEPQ